MSRMFQKFFSMAGFIVMLALLSIPVFGQEYRGRVQGTVMDSSQGAIVGATVTLLNSKTGVAAVRQTSETGHYLFDLVEPGTYSIAVEFQGFNKFVQENTAVPSRADLTVDAVLKPGEIKETISVVAEAASLQFSTSKLETTVDSTLTQHLPQMHRNAFLLAQLDPAVENTTWGEQEPYHSWSANNQRIGGSAAFTNDLQIDGSPVGISLKVGYIPTVDMVQEINIQQNAVDAEYGNSSGSTISIVLKSGSNEYHGSAFYQGQYPWANALENRVYRTENLGRNHMYGGTFSSPIFKNKLFNFVAYEGWAKTDPFSLLQTLPTERERQGDFSQTLNADGALRVIYDPWSTVTSPDGTITRTPFPNNIIPADRIDPIAKKYSDMLWKPNSPALDNFDTNNFAASLAAKFPYKNFSDRVDYQVSDKLRVYGRFSLFRTPVQPTTNPTGSDLFQSDRGSSRDATSISGDATYTLNAKTVIDFHGGYHSFVDASHFTTDYSSEGGWAKTWANSDFYKVMFTDPNIPVLIPRMSIRAQDGWGRRFDMGPGGGYWKQLPNLDEFNAKIAQMRGAHYLKTGFETRGARGSSMLLMSNPGFGFDAFPTSNTYINPNALLSGDGYATFLLGAVVPNYSGAGDWDSGSTSMPVNIYPTTVSRFYGAYINDDWKISRDLTLNLGLRYEYEGPYSEAQNRLTRAPDLTSPIPELQGLQMPDVVKQYYDGSWILNGAFQFTDGDHRSSWNGGKGSLSPRIGAAYRLNDKTALRAAYGRYVTPWAKNSNENQLEAYYYGFANVTGAPAEIQGVPQMRLQDPFPASYPIQPSYGKSLGRYTMLGDSFTFPIGDRPRSKSDRLNFSVQRQLPGGIVLDVTYFRNWTSQVFDTTYNINQVDPKIWYKYKGETNQTVPNPFYNLLPVEKFPGQLRYRETLSITELMKPYPQYGDLRVIDGVNGGNMRYQALQIKAQRNFRNGFSGMIGYSYHRETDQRFYDDVANYLKEWSWQDSYFPRHRLTSSYTWELPFGKGRAYMAGAPRLLDAVAGGWSFSGMLYWRSGNLLNFGGMLANGDPTISNPTPQKWFDTSVFQRLPDYTERTNPWFYSGLRGPGEFNLDTSLVKAFHITEKLRAQLRMDAFNALNGLTWSDPSTDVNSGTFGQCTSPLFYTFGRRVQLGFRMEF